MEFSGLGLGNAQTYYLNVGVYGTDFGSSTAYVKFTLSSSGEEQTIAAKCNPGNTCPVPRLTTCVANYQLKPPFSQAAGGSVTITAMLAGFLSTGCKAGESDVNVTYTLQSTFPMPTNEPTASPTALSPSAMQSQLSSSTNEVIVGSGALFYVIAAIGVVFAVLSVIVAQMKQQQPAVYQIGLVDGIVAMTLVGTAFASEMFLVHAMMGTTSGSGTFLGFSSGIVLGFSVLVGRLLHLPVTGFLLRSMFGGKAYNLASYLHQDLVFGSAKIFGIVALFGMIDVSVVRYFPWLSSPFSRKTNGFPTMTVFRVCVLTKLVQSVVTVGCQISYFFLVNSAIMADTPQARQSFAFLCINLATTVLLVVLNAFEYIMKGSILKGNNISDVPDDVVDTRKSGETHSLPPPHQQQRSIFSRISQRLSFDELYTSRDTIPNSVSIVSNPMGNSCYVRGSEGASRPSVSQDIELALTARDSEIQAQLQTLAQQNAQMHAMMSKLTAQMSTETPVAATPAAATSPAHNATALPSHYAVKSGATPPSPSSPAQAKGEINFRHSWR